MQYEIVFKGDRIVHVILAFLEVLLLLLKLLENWLLVLLLWLDVYARTKRQSKVQHEHIHAYKSTH